MIHQQDPSILAPPAIPWPQPPRSKWEREHRAFHRLLPQLLSSHPGHYVAIHDEQVVDSDRDEMALITRVLARLGNVDIHVAAHADESWVLLGRDVLNSYRLLLDGPQLVLEIG